jgi:hypothetical protein
MSAFAFDLREYAKKAEQTIGDAVREIVITIGTLVDERSPVGQPDIWAANIARASRGLPPVPKGYLGGHFRANNQYQFGSVPASEVEGEDPIGASAMAAIRNGVMMAPASGVHYVANIVPYAQALEEGHSTQAPFGIYGLAQLDTENAARAILKEIE